MKENLETGLSTNNELALGLVKVVLRNLEVELETQSQVRRWVERTGVRTGAGPLRIRPAVTGASIHT